MQLQGWGLTWKEGAVPKPTMHDTKRCLNLCSNFLRHRKWRGDQFPSRIAAALCASARGRRRLEDLTLLEIPKWAKK